MHPLFFLVGTGGSDHDLGRGARVAGSSRRYYQPFMGGPSLAGHAGRTDEAPTEGGRAQRSARKMGPQTITFGRLM